jgi:CRP/FNR family transcriptional regulator, cyclic AMP receptor protein
MPAHSKLWYLERFRLLDVLSDSQKRSVEALARMSEVKRGTRIYLPGDPSNQIFLLKSGVMKIASLGPDGREMILTFLHAGDLFGELAVVDESPRDHLAEAYADAVICAVDRQTFLQLLRQSPELGYQITKLMGLRLKTLRTRVEELLYKSAQHRVAHTLLWLADEHGIRDAAGVLIPIRLTQRDLGNLVGLSRESVNFILQDFRARGLLEAERRSIRLKDPEALAAVR